MDKETERLQAAVADIEYVADQVLVTRHEMVECDRARNSNREAATALRRQARTSKSSVDGPPKRALISLIGEEAQTGPEKCLTCGDHDGSSPVMVMGRSADIFVRMSFHDAHLLLEKEGKELEVRSKSLQSFLKDKTMLLSQKGGLSDRIPASLISAFANLKDNS